MLIIPAIDLKDGRCVRLLQGRKSEMTVYNENPVEVAREFVAAGAQMIHVVDLDGAFNESGSPNRAVVREIIEAVDALPSRPYDLGVAALAIDSIVELEAA